MKKTPTAKLPALFCYLPLDLLFASHGFLRLNRTIGRYRRNIGRRHAGDTQLLPQLRVHTGKDVFVLFQEGADVLATLADAFALVAVPCATLVHDVVQHREIENIALTRNPLAIENVELRIAKRSRHLIFDNLDLGAGTDNRIAILHRPDAADIDADRGVELQRLATGGRLRIAEHHANLLANLVDEDQTGARLRNRSRKLSESLRHETSLQPHMRVAHLP